MKSMSLIRMAYLQVIIVIIQLGVPKVCVSDILQVPTEYADIQLAINESSLNDTILISPGEYSQQLFIFEHALTLASRYLTDLDSSLISATILAPPEVRLDSIWRVLTVTGPMTDTLRLIGLTIREGYLSFDSPPPADMGAGVFMSRVAVELRSNRFIDNNAALGQGGAVGLDSCTVILSDNLFEQNFAFYEGAGAYLRFCNSTIVGNRFLGNSGRYGVGLCLNGGSAIISQNEFVENVCLPTGQTFGGGLAIASHGDTWVIENNHFIRNSSMMGGGLLVTDNNDSLIIRGNQFFSNNCYQSHFSYGGAIQIGYDTGSVEIDSNQFVGNSTYVNGGAISCNSSATISNNLILRNRAVFGAAITSWGNVPIELDIHHNAIIENDTVHFDDWRQFGIVLPAHNTLMNIHENDFFGNVFIVVANRPQRNGYATAIDNFWGDASGPFHPTHNPDGLGDFIGDDVDFLPFSTAPWTDFLSPHLNLDRSEIDFDSVMIGEQKQESLVLSNSGGQDLAITSVDVQGAGFGIMGRTLTSISPLTSGTLTFFFAPVQAGAHEGDLTITSDDPDSPQIVIPLRGFALSDMSSFQDDSRPERFAIRSLYPNPANGQITVSVTLPQTTPLLLKITNILGREVYSEQWLSLPAGSHHLTLPFSNHASGIYFVQLEIPDESVHLRRKFTHVR